MTATISGYEDCCRPRVRLTQTPVAKTDDYTVLTTDVGKLLTNTGAAKAITFTLPAVAAWNGHAIRFRSNAAYAMILAPQSGECVFIDGDGVASKGASLGATAGNMVEVFNNGSSIEVIASNGSLLKQA